MTAPVVVLRRATSQPSTVPPESESGEYADPRASSRRPLARVLDITGGGRSYLGQSHPPDLRVLRRHLDSDEPASDGERRYARASRSRERVQNQVAWIGACPQAAVYQLYRLLRRMLAKPLLRLAGRGHSPDRLHLLAAVLASHLIVIERVLVTAALRRLARPQHDLRRVGERPAPQIRRRIRLLPDNIVQQPKAVLQQRHAHAGIYVERPRHPDSPRRLQYAVAFGDPLHVELVVQFQPPALVPVALVHAHHASRHAGYPAVGQQIRRIGPHAIHALVREARERLDRLANVQRGVLVRGNPHRIRRERDLLFVCCHARIIDRISGRCQALSASQLY